MATAAVNQTTRVKERTNSIPLVPSSSRDTEDEVAASRVSRNIGYCGSENSFMNALSIFNENCFSSGLRFMFVFVLSMDARFVRASGVF